MVINEGIKAADAAGITLPSGKYFNEEIYRVKTAEDVQRAFDFIDNMFSLLGKHKDESEKAGKYNYVKKAGGIWWDLVIRKRKTETLWTDGRFVEKGKEAGVEMPLSERMCEMIYEIEDGKREMGWHNLDELAEYAKEIGYSLPGFDWER